MKLRRGKSAAMRVPRQRVREQASPPAGLSYRGRLSDQTANTGRQLNREAIRTSSQKAGRFWLQRFGLLILLLALGFSAINVLSLTPTAKVLPLTTNGSRTFLHDQSAYQAAADKALASSIWNRNKITINTHGVSRQLQNQFPELASVNIVLPLLAHRPVVYVQPAQPAVLLIARNGSYVLDTSGKALLLADKLPAGVLPPDLPQVTDQSGLTVHLNHQALTRENVSFIQTIITQLAARHITVSSLSLPPAASELDVHIVGQPYYGKFNLHTDDARQQAGTFLAVVAELQRQNITPAQYIDVRVDGRAYYQ